MHGKKLFELAKLVGLTQSAVARHLSISRVQVHFWAQGHRPIPVHSLKPLMELVFQAVKAFLKSDHADIAEIADIPATNTLGSGMVFKSPKRLQIEALLYACTVENMELRGVGPSASITDLAAEISTYASMPAGTLRKPETARHVLELSIKMQVQCEMLLSLGPLMDFVAGDGVPEESTQAELSA